ncbi:hypothetical protein BGZ63DRAFT_399990 [Mariannaea sp. PMI_226]|nr:hypothetical protein BGZ63DRAFT_399990 [Mariannaea sp. PMI_226]
MAAATRLSYMNPHLLRAVRAGWSPRAGAELTRHRGTFARRRGKAVEPPQLNSTNSQTTDALPDTIIAAAPSTMGVGQIPTQQSTNTTESASATSGANVSSSSNSGMNTSAKPSAQSGETANTEPASKESKSSPEQSAEEERARLAREEAKQSGPLEAVLHMEPPENMDKPSPALTPSSYIHHFDTFSLVKQLSEGGYTNDQAITSMKAIRTSLAQNLDVAQSTLVSKSDVENETYLFTAACSELSTEIKNNRRLSEEQMRQQRIHLQHEVDILTQTLNQELLTLNDNVRGMFNDRRMTVREEQKAVESAVQQINYKISILLTSDAKSEIEAVRWILIRRSVLGILFMAVLTLGTLRYATYVSHERQREADKKKHEEEEIRRNGGKRDHTSDADAAAILAAN